MPRKLSRRTLLKSAALATAATRIAPALAAPATQPAFAWPENGMLIPDDGWHLWVDTAAHWETDDIFLPEDIAWLEHDGKQQLCAKGHPLPINAPTGGWSVLTPTQGKQIVLPTSVEQHFWGVYGASPDGKPRPYTPEEYRYAKAPTGAPADDDIPRNGAYFGVSWFFRPIDIPASMQGKRIFLHLRGAHLRAEVYLNGQLCGYSILEELPFEADLTTAAKPGGENLLAIRITNPFGRFDWVDGLNAKWGKVSLYRSHGFGALDRGITISAHDAGRISDLYVLNTPDPKRISIHWELDFALPSWATSMKLEVLDASTRRVVLSDVSNFSPAQSEPQSRFKSSETLKLASSQLWDVAAPRLYHLRATVTDHNGRTDTRTTVFAFRSFTTEGIGTNALFRLNSRRIRIYSAISWGFWGLNGMFPIPELAEKEVRAAQQLGLNCLNFHRNLAKEDVLRKHDELGLLRYMEPGAGRLAIGKLPGNNQANSNSIVMEPPANEAEHFAQRYIFTKCVEMVKAFRTHPSVIEYCLQNELGADFHNPATLAVLKAMHDEDPSRAVVLNDGFVAPPRSAAQAWYEPWTFAEESNSAATSASSSHLESRISNLVPGKLHRSDQEPFGAWWNNHQGAGDQWYDQFYESPTDYTYRSPEKSGLSEFGEMEGCARPDNHPLMVHQIETTYLKYSGPGSKPCSYDLADHEAVIAGYERFLDKWNFRKSFPTSEAVFKAVGRTCYESWQNYMENARISDELDFAAISGWESTAIENHSGIVDNLRNHKSDPELIRGSLLPIRPIAKQRSLVAHSEQGVLFDLYLANDTSQPVQGEMIFSVIDPANAITELARFPLPPQTPDRFSYLIKEAFLFKPRERNIVNYPGALEGRYRFRCELSNHPTSTQQRDVWIFDSPCHCIAGRSYRVAIAGLNDAVLKGLRSWDPIFALEPFKPGTHYDVIVTSGMTNHTKTEDQIGETTGESMPVMKPGHTPEPGEVPEPTQLGAFAPGILDAVRAGTPLLAIPQADTLSEGLARELSSAGAFTYHGAVGDFRAPWMGNWYFVREHPLFDGMPTNCALGGFYQCPGRQSNGLLIDRAPNGPDLEVIVGYSRDHDRNVGAGTFTTRLGKGKVLFHRVPPMHPVMQQRFLANALRWLTT